MGQLDFKLMEKRKSRHAHIPRTIYASLVVCFYGVYDLDYEAVYEKLQGY